MRRGEPGSPYCRFKTIAIVSYIYTLMAPFFGIFFPYFVNTMAEVAILFRGQLKERGEKLLVLFPLLMPLCSKSDYDTANNMLTTPEWLINA